MAEDEIDERLSRRLGDTADQDDEAAESQTVEADMKSQTSQQDSSSQKAQNIKKEWNVRSFYLDDQLDRDVSMAYKRLDLELSETDGSEVDLQKTRHFYPLLVALGLEKLESMDITEVKERIESME